MRILVIRPPGDKLSPESVINSIVTQQNVGVELGKSYIYDSATYSEYNINMPYRGELYPGNKVSIYDETLGEDFVGIVTRHGISIKKGSEISPVKIRSDLTVRRILLDE